MMYKLSNLLVIAFCFTFVGCTCNDKQPKTKEFNVLQQKIYATEVSKEDLDIPMIATAIYSNGTHFYGTNKVYYELSEGELTKIRSILSKQLPKMIPVNTIQLDLNTYFKQYLAYMYRGRIYVLVNLYKYYYIYYSTNPNKGVSSPAKGLHIISLRHEQNRSKYDNLMILLNLSKSRILRIETI
nr:hypothetical protein [uncultured Prevotella sp.]